MTLVTAPHQLSQSVGAAPTTMQVPPQLRCRPNSHTFRDRQLINSPRLTILHAANTRPRQLRRAALGCTHARRRVERFAGDWPRFFRLV